MARKNEDGELEVITPQQSSWNQMYVNNVVIEEEMHYQNEFCHTWTQLRIHNTAFRINEYESGNEYYY